MSPEEKIERTKDAVEDLRVKRESRKHDAHNVPIGVFHDVCATVAKIEREVRILPCPTLLRLTSFHSFLLFTIVRVPKSFFVSCGATPSIGRNCTSGQHLRFSTTTSRCASTWSSVIGCKSWSAISSERFQVCHQLLASVVLLMHGNRRQAEDPC